MIEEAVTVAWRGVFGNDELHALHAAAFGTRVYDAREWDWIDQVTGHSLGWVTARDGDRLVGFANVPWDGLVHAYLEDVCVDDSVWGRGVGIRLVHAARDGARDAGCEYLHVSFDTDLRPFYVDAAGFRPVLGGVLEL